MPDFELSSSTLAELFRARGDDLLVWFTRRTWDREAAVDMTSETFAQALASRGRFRGRSEAEADAWLYGIARNVLRMYLRRGAVEQQALARLGLQRIVPTEGDLARLEREAGLVSLRESLAARLGDLPDAQAEAVRLRIVDELPYDVIAARTGASPEAVRVRVSRGLRTLRALLAHEPVEDFV